MNLPHVVFGYFAKKCKNGTFSKEMESEHDQKHTEAQ